LGGSQVSLALGAEAKFGEGGGLSSGLDFGLEDNGGISTITWKLTGNVGYGVSSPINPTFGGGISSKGRLLMRY